MRDTVLRVVIWAWIAVGLVRGLWIFDGGASANNAETIAAGVCFGCSLLATVLMFLFDGRRPTDRTR